MLAILESFCFQMFAKVFLNFLQILGNKMILRSSGNNNPYFPTLHTIRALLLNSFDTIQLNIGSSVESEVANFFTVAVLSMLIFV